MKAAMTPTTMILLRLMVPFVGRRSRCLLELLPV